MKWWEEQGLGAQPATGFASTELFAEWLLYMDPAVAGFEDFGLPRNFGVPHRSREAMGELGHVVLSRYEDESGVLSSGEHRAWIDGCVRYVGVTLIGHAGGGWVYDVSQDAVDPGRPVVELDTEDRVRVSPHVWIREVARSRDPDVFVAGFDRWVGVARAWAVSAGHGEPRVDEEPMDPDVVARRAAGTARWVESLEPGAARFVASCPVGGPWDGSLESIDRLEALLLERYSSLEEYRAPDLSDWRRDVERYLGLAVQRLHGGDWIYDDWEEPNDYDASGRPWLVREDKKSGLAHDFVPEVDLEVTVDAGSPGTLRRLVGFYGP